MRVAASDPHLRFIPPPARPPEGQNWLLGSNAEDFARAAESVCVGRARQESLKFSALVEVPKGLPVVSNHQDEQLDSTSPLVTPEHVVNANYITASTAPVGEI